MKIGGVVIIAKLSDIVTTQKKREKGSEEGCRHINRPQFGACFLRGCMI